VLSSGQLNCSAYSTEIAFLKVANDVERVADFGKCTELLTLDISSAFDAVSRTILCHRDSFELGIKGSVLAWL
jgi:hypothetical protein